MGLSHVYIYIYIFTYDIHMYARLFFARDFEERLNFLAGLCGR